jgi:hypothetical protein
VNIWLAVVIVVFGPIILIRFLRSLANHVRRTWAKAPLQRLQPKQGLKRTHESPLPPNARLSCRGRLQETWTPKNQGGGPGQLQPLVVWQFATRSATQRGRANRNCFPANRDHQFSPHFAAILKV